MDILEAQLRFNGLKKTKTWSQQLISEDPCMHRSRFMSQVHSHGYTFRPHSGSSSEAKHSRYYGVTSYWQVLIEHQSY